MSGDASERTCNAESKELEARYIVAHRSHAIFIGANPKKSMSEQGLHKPPQHAVHRGQNAKIEQQQYWCPIGPGQDETQVRSLNENAIGSTPKGRVVEYEE